MKYEQTYYETEPFAFYFFNPEKIGKYSPIEKGVEGVISIFVEEEFLHQMTRGHWKKWVNKEEYDFMDIWENFELRKNFFKIENLSTKSISRKYNEIIGLLVKNFGGEFPEKTPSQMDLLHLASGELSNCIKLLTMGELPLPNW